MLGVMKQLCIATLVLLTACASNDVQRVADAHQQATTETQALLSGEQLFGAQVPAAPAIDIFALNGAMHAWVKSNSGRYPAAKSRLKQLLQGMIDDGLLNLKYDRNLSLTAQETFARHHGNCLSFSVLFVALARAANLDVQFQLVEIPPSFSNAGELVLLNNHINVLVTGIRSDVNFTQDHVVDFNRAEFKGNYDSRRVSDNYAVSLYHSNVAVEALQRQDYRAAFSQLKRGIEVGPQIASLWVNLGVLYSRRGLLNEAELAYEQALVLEPRNKSALVNLTKVSRQLGKTEQAEQYAQRVRRYLNSNPYYFRHRAQRALASGEIDAALQHIDRAIALKKDEHQFHYLKGVVLYQAGRAGLAQKSFSKARRVAHREDVRQAYNRKIAALSGETS